MGAGQHHERGKSNMSDGLKTIKKFEEWWTREGEHFKKNITQKLNHESAIKAVAEYGFFGGYAERSTEAI